jgi:hypothetical protein
VRPDGDEGDEEASHDRKEQQDSHYISEPG